MLSLRARIFIIISLIVLVILGISLFLLVRAKKQAATTAGQPVAGENLPVANGLPAVAPTPVTDVSGNIKVNPVSSVETQKNAAEQIAKIFFERYNSYSSESQYQNVRDVQALVSKSYWTQLSAKLPSVKTVQNTVAPFSSTITKAYSSKLSSWSEQSAIVDLQVKILEERNGIVGNRDQQATVYLVKDGQNWLVDKFEWGK
ncbi:MAG: hypothetical protein WCT11_01720 [Candidatus Magasanikbacteria bacterium]